MNDAVGEIKARLPIENLVAEYVVLKRVGKSLKGLCPFHSEKTPSFIVSPDKGIAYCFGCQKGGDIFRFLMEVENVDFPEALKILSDKTGVELEKESKKNFIKKSEKDVLLDIHEACTVFFQETLWGAAGEKARVYLTERGMTEETMRLFRLGLSPDSFEETHQMLLKKGFNQSQILQSGLAIAKDTSMVHIYDRFRGRLMFPVMDSLGRVVGFGGRALQSDQQPKYLNSPETPIYQKNQLLYGFFQSKPFIKSMKQVVIVEGYMDYLMAFQDGVKNVAAVNGTALTMRHLTQLKPYIDELVFSFDMDRAGQEAARRSFELTQDFEFLVKVLVLPSGKDIADFVKGKPGEIGGLLSKIQLFADFFYEDLFKRFDKNSLSEKRKMLAEFASLMSKIKSSVERDSYVRRLAADLSVPEVQIYDELNIMKLSNNHPARKAMESEKAKQYLPEELLLGLLLNYPKCVYDIKDRITQDDLPEKIKAIYIRFLSNYNPERTDQDAVLAILSELDGEHKPQASLMSLYAEEIYGDFPPEMIQKEVIDLIAKIKQQKLSGLRQKLQQQLKAAEAGQDQDEMQKILIELRNLSMGKIN